MDAATLKQAISCTDSLAKAWALPLSLAMAEFGINTCARQAAFLAQIAHESGRLQWVRELWGPTEVQKGYEGRRDLGNVQPGDGFKFRGRGLIQITGRANYATVGKALKLPLDNTPTLLEQPLNAARSAGYFWESHGLNALADTGNFDAICDIINLGHQTAKIGDSNGYAQRVILWQDCRRALQCG